MSEEKHGFQAEVSRLLHIVAHSLYADRSVFLRELVSNASDACDRLRYLALTQPELLGAEAPFRITLTPDKAARTLTLTDNGIGMNRGDLIENLGTIARSGTAAFVKDAGEAGDDGAKDLSLIGQFGVGFYAAFMVASPVEVVSRKAGEADAWRWSSDGSGGFTTAPCPADEAPARGTRVVLHLRQGEDDYLDPERLRQLVARYSDHIAVPIVLIEGDKERTLNAASALWLRPKAEITPAQYAEFYRHVAHASDEPWLVLHNRAEGKIEYTVLAFVPTLAPFDLFDPERRNGLKLYVKRVFITDDCRELLPGYLRFLRGIVDSEDLPLSISREMLQHNPMLAKIRQGLIKRVLAELKKKAENDADGYAAFWNNFGAVLKEGLYEGMEQRPALLDLARFRSTSGDGLVSFKDYLARMKPGQEAIYTVSGDTPEAARRSPQIEGFVAHGVEVLLMTDPVDEFWLTSVHEYEGKPFRSVTRGAADLDRFAAPPGDTGPKPDATAAAAAQVATDNLLALLRLTLKDAVKDVRASTRLTDSPVCLVADEGDLDVHLERVLLLHKRIDKASKRILELNPRHALIVGLAQRLGTKGAADEIAEAAWLLLDQARLLQGEPLPDVVAFSRRLGEVMRRALVP